MTRIVKIREITYITNCGGVSESDMKGDNSDVIRMRDPNHWKKQRAYIERLNRIVKPSV